MEHGSRIGAFRWRGAAIPATFRPMRTYLLVALGGALGSVARFGIGEAMGRWLGQSFPWATLLVNVLGSFAIGWLATSPATADLAPSSRAFFMAGICGGFTTFSAFSLQTLELARQGNPGAALGNVGLSLALCFAAVWLGHATARAGT